ncbi:YadA-like family protein [Dyella sp. LX-66]|uniref:YadA-like family protein n=2 Tax=unclassified Dyella TaxID=2634549 RepID=UPI0031F32F96
MAITILGFSANLALAETDGTTEHAATSCTTTDGKPGTINPQNACAARNSPNSAALAPRTIASRATLDDGFIKVIGNTSSSSTTPATANGSGAIAIGDGAQSGASSGTVDTVAIGISSKAIGRTSVALGRAASSSGIQSTAIGNEASSAATNSLAFGASSLVDSTSTGAVALGAGASVAANAANSVALGNNSTVSAANTVSVGNSTTKRTIVNMGNGVSANDAVNVSQLSPVITALGGGAKIDATTGAVTGPTYTLTNGGAQTTVGGALTSLDTAITNANKYYKVNTYSTAANAVANGTGAIAIGGGAVAGKDTTTTDSVAIGLYAKAEGSQAIALGRSSIASATHAVALSDSAKAQSENSLAVGYNATVDSTASGGMAVGAGASVGTSATNSIALGYGSTVTEANTVSIGSSTLARKLTGLADGTLSSTSKDAVTGAQLYATNQNVTTNATNITALQGQINNGSVGLVQQDATTKKITVAAGAEGDTVDFSGKKDGKTTSRKLTGLSDGTLSSTSTDAVTGAQLYATNEKVTANTKDITTNAGNISSLQTQINEGTIGLVKQDATSNAITVGGASGGTSISFAGTSGGRVLSGLANGTADDNAVTIAQLKAVGLVDPDGKTLAALVYTDLTMSTAMLGGTKGTVIRNLANGSIAHGSMEAVNGGQLFDMQQDITNQMNALNGQVGALSNQVNQIQQGLDDGSLGGSGGGGAGTGTGSATLGDGANASGTNSTAVGTGSNASGSGSTATGAGSNASGDNSTATGTNAVASGTGSTANGNGAQALGNNSSASGANAIASGEGSTANGANATAAGTNSTALGANSNATSNNSVALGANSTADRDNTVSVGSAGNERQITNVAAGTQRTDAANWGQVQDAVQGVQDWANRKFEQVDSRINRMGAMSAAYSQMAFSATGVNTPNRFGVGVGMQGGKSAVAMGVSHQFSPNINVSFGGSSSGKETSVGAGMAIGW